MNPIRPIHLTHYTHQNLKIKSTAISKGSNIMGYRIKCDLYLFFQLSQPD